MRVTFLGTGTSHGVPMIGCDCPVCRSENPKNKRTRSSVLVESNGASILIDTTPEFRIQVLRENVRRIDAVLFTHAHADHIFGLDDVRRFNDMSCQPMPCYGTSDTIRTIRKAFEYVFVPTQLGGGKPSLDLCEVNGRLDICGVRVTPVPVLHGALPILGYRIGDFAYLTDCSEIPEASFELLHGVDTLALGVLRHEPHETHFSLAEGVAVVERLTPRQAFFTHIAHKLDHDTTNRVLPPNAQLAHDGLRVELRTSVG